MKAATVSVRPSVRPSLSVGGKNDRRDDGEEESETPTASSDSAPPRVEWGQKKLHKTILKMYM